jgi:hypothetical protein
LASQTVAIQEQVFSGISAISFFVLMGVINVDKQP